MDTPTAAGRRPSGETLQKIMVLLATVCAGTAGAAPCAASRCDVAAQDLQAAGLPLTVRSVDLGDAGMGDDSAAASNVSGSMAPLLFLGPRVTSILEDVFEADEPAGAADETEAFAAEAAEALSSPVAETDTTSAGRAPSPETDHASILPKYQRQMYRTDI